MGSKGYDQESRGDSKCRNKGDVDCNAPNPRTAKGGTEPLVLAVNPCNFMALLSEISLK